MTHSTLAEDLAYVKDLAEAGQQAPLLGGRFLAFWGGLSALTFGAHYSILTFMSADAKIYLNYIWISAAIIGTLGHFGLIKSMSGNKPGMSSVGNRVEQSVWMISSLAFGVYFFAQWARALFKGDYSGFVTAIPIVFLIYGIALFMSGHLSGTKILKWASAGCFAVVAFSIWFQGTYMIWALASLGMLVSAFLPGLILLRREPKEIV